MFTKPILGLNKFTINLQYFFLFLKSFKIISNLKFKFITKQENKLPYLESCNDANSICDNSVGLSCQQTDSSKTCQ